MEVDASDLLTAMLEIKQKRTGLGFMHMMSQNLKSNQNSFRFLKIVYKIRLNVYKYGIIYAEDNFNTGPIFQFFFLRVLLRQKWFALFVTLEA